MFYRVMRNHLSLILLFFTPLILTCLISCDRTPAMKIFTNKDLLDSLDEHTQEVVIGLPEGPQMIITPELSARVLGASLDGINGENLLWVNNSIYDGSYWAAKPYFWNAGGYRTWVAPEDMFFLDENDEWFVPSQLDVAPYRIIDQNDFGVTLEADINLKTNIDKYYKMTIERNIMLLTESPSEVESLPDNVHYMGIYVKHSLTNRSEEIIGVDMPYVCLWNLLQIKPSGTTLVPLQKGFDPRTAYREYFNPLGDRITVSNDIISVKIDGEYRSKIGVRAEAAKSGLAFLRDNHNNTGVLYVMLFSIDPNGIYVDKPWGTDSDYGDAVELYNDDGNMGGFAEIECHGPAEILRRGESQSHTISLHIYSGPISELKRIGSILLDADLTAAVYY